MKKLILVSLITLLIILSSISAMSETVISVYLDGQKMQFDQNPVIENGYTLVPMRSIFEALGANVTWEQSTKSVYAEKGTRNMVITVDNKEAVVNRESYTLDAPARNLNGRVLVPLRFIGEQLGLNVNWDGNTKTVYLTTNAYKDFPKYPGVMDIREFMGIDKFIETEKDGATIYSLDRKYFEPKYLDVTYEYYEYLEQERGFNYVGKVSDIDLGENCYQYKNDKYTLTISVKDGGYYCKVANN